MMSSYAVSCLLKALKAYFYIHNIFILHYESFFSLHNTTFLCTVGCNIKLHNMYHHICVSKPSQLPDVNFILVHHQRVITSELAQLVVQNTDFSIVFRIVHMQTIMFCLFVLQRPSSSSSLRFVQRLVKTRLGFETQPIFYNNDKNFIILPLHRCHDFSS